MTSINRYCDTVEASIERIERAADNGYISKCRGELELYALLTIAEGLGIVAHEIAALREHLANHEIMKETIDEQ